MGILREPIEKALRRSRALDLAEFVATRRNRTPSQLTTAQDQEQRASFPSRSRGTAAAPIVLERILAGNELQGVNYLSRGAKAALAVGCINAPSASGRGHLAGTGFVTVPRVLITNNHTQVYCQYPLPPVSGGYM